ncbi:hypothetical protein D3C73_1349500 [compost metagenome]
MISASAVPLDPLKRYFNNVAPEVMISSPNFTVEPEAALAIGADIQPFKGIRAPVPATGPTHNTPASVNTAHLLAIPLPFTFTSLCFLLLKNIWIIAPISSVFKRFNPHMYSTNKQKNPLMLIDLL